jgi:hypothetical protein
MVRNLIEKTKKAILILTGLFLFLGTRAFAYNDGDFQVWNTDVEELKVDKNLRIALEEEFRWADNASEFYYHHYDAGLYYALNKYWNFGGGYRQIYELTRDKFKAENEPYITATLSLTGGGFTFESRNRMEYRHFDYKADSGRYRNKFTLRHPSQFDKIEIQPFLSEEVFFGFGGTNQFNQNRLSSGLGSSLTKNIKAEIYYMLVTVKSSGGWVDSNVLGTKLKLAF